MRTSVIALLSFTCCAGTAAAGPPERLLADPDSLRAPLELPVIAGRTSRVSDGVVGKSEFGLHSYVLRHKGVFYVMWSSAVKNEEDPDQHLRFATSRDGHTWSASRVLAADPDGPTGPQRWIARGLFVEKGRLMALGALVEGAMYNQQGKGVVWPGLKLMAFEWTGKSWKSAGLYADDCMNNFPPEPLQGRLFMVCRDKDMTMKTALRRNDGAWEYRPFPSPPPFNKMDEPAWYVAPDGTAHMIIRDGNRSKKLLRSISTDGGVTWTTPVFTDYPDATSKNFIGRLSNGVYYLISNPNPASRDPLAISFSKDGQVFSQPMAVRKNAPARRFGKPGSNPRKSFQYPNATEANGSLWVVYSTNKEDIEITEIRLRDIPLK